MGELDRLRRIEAGALDEEAYVDSLLAAGVEAGLLSGADLERIQLECLELLGRKTERYTGGESSSVRVETAQALMVSNLFTVGVYLKTSPDADAAVETLQTQPISELYALGRKRIDVKVRTARARHNTLLAHLTPNPNECYIGTVRDGIRGFFKRYDPDFAAQEIHITADYPLCNPVGRLAGIEFIQSYLDALICENAFLSCFDPAALHRMLLGYSPDYAVLIFNLYEQALASAVGCILTGTDLAQLSVSGADARRLQASLLCKSKDEIGALVAAAAQTLSAALSLPRSVQRYLCRALPSLTGSLAIAVEHLYLERLFPAARY